MTTAKAIIQRAVEAAGTDAALQMQVRCDNLKFQHYNQYTFNFQNFSLFVVFMKICLVDLGVYS